MSAPPIPPPSAYSCPHCGHAMAQAMDFCPQCGMRLSHAPRFAGCYITILVLLALPSALAGGCFLLFSSFESSSPDRGMVAIGLLGLAFSALCIWGVVRLVKARRG